MKHNTHKHIINRLRTVALITTLITNAAVAAESHSDPERSLDKMQIGLGIGGQFSSVDLTGVPAGFEDASDDGVGVNFALSLGYRLNHRTTLVSAVHYVHQVDERDAMRGIGMLGVGVRHRFDQSADGWYVDGQIGGTFVTQSFDDADDLDDDNFATGKGLRLAVGRSVGKIEAASAQLQLTWDIR